MDLTRRQAGLIAVAAPLAACASETPRPLPSWNEGIPRQTILEFVHRVTTKGPDFVPPARRIATFDNDGTLWVEQPIYTQALFMADRAKALAADNPALRTQAPYRALLDGDRGELAKLTEKDVFQLLSDTHSGMTTEDFARTARTWIDTTRDPRFHRLYRELIYQPQLELLAFLRDNGFTTFIVSGGGVEFMRAFAQAAYDIPPHQVVGSSGKAVFAMREGRGFIVKEPGLGSLDDKAGKPVNINLHIGQRPILAFGNSDGDLEMLQYTTTGDGPRLGLLVRHDDATREYAYDRDSLIGKLDIALDEAMRRDWTVVSMKRDWNVVFPFEQTGRS